MFGLEFSGISELPHNFERIETDLEGFNANMLKNLETGRQAFEFNCAVDSFRESLVPLELNSISRDNKELYEKLKKLREKSYKISTTDELEALKKQFEQLQSSQASLQAATTAQAEFAVKQAAVKPKITDVSKEAVEIITEPVKSAAQVSQQPGAKVVMDEAAIKAEAIARTQAQKQAVIDAEKAQKFYSSLSNAATGKSAAGSDKVFEEAAVKSEAAVNQAVTQTINKADDIANNSNNLKDKISKFIKSKKFKYGALALAALACVSAIFIHLKKKNEKKQKINVVK